MKKVSNTTIRVIVYVVLIATWIVLCNLPSKAHAQSSYSVQGTTYVAQKASKASATQTEFTFQDAKGNTYPIWLSKNGHAFVKRVSQKSGKEYNQYLSEEISRDICKKLGREYVVTKKQ